MRHNSSLHSKQTTSFRKSKQQLRRQQFPFTTQFLKKERNSYTIHYNYYTQKACNPLRPYNGPWIFLRPHTEDHGHLKSLTAKLTHLKANVFGPSYISHVTWVSQLSFKTQCLQMRQISVISHYRQTTVKNSKYNGHLEVAFTVRKQNHTMSCCNLPKTRRHNLKVTSLLP